MNFTANTLMLVGFLISILSTAVLLIYAAWASAWVFLQKFFSCPILWWSILSGVTIFIVGLTVMFFSPEKPDESIVKS